MVECPECGEILTESDKRCPSCGHKISKQDNTNSSSKNKQFSNNKILAIIAIIAVIAIVGVLASGMFSGDTSTDDVSVENEDTVAPIEENVSSDDASATTEYWASAKTDKFHLPTCEWAEKISDDNKIVYDNREDAIADGKEPCGVCNP